MQMVKERAIAIEVCPISNQMLRLLDDFRNHPAVVLLANGLPVTISSDDSVIYGYQGVTFDFYEAYMAWNLTLSGLKVLTRNSLVYSTLGVLEKKQAILHWESIWQTWIDSVLQGSWNRSL